MDVLQGGRSVLSFDSMQSQAQDSNNPVAPILRAMIGARIQYFTDADGKVQKVGGVDDLTKRFEAIRFVFGRAAEPIGECRRKLVG